jgi:hypothetical protein
VVDEDGEHPLEVPFVQDQHPIQTLRANRADEALRDPVRLRRAKWRPNDLDAFPAKHVVKALGNF